MEKLKFIFELFDKMSGPGARISKELKQMQGELGGAGKGTEGLGAALQSAGGQAMLFGAGLGGWIQVAKTTWDVAMGLQQQIFGLAKAFFEGTMKTLAFKESTLMSLQVMLKSKDAAKTYFDQLVKFADVTPFSTEDVVKYGAALTGAGFKQKESLILLQAIGDAAASSGKGVAAIEGIMNQVTQIKGTGRMNTMDMRVIQQWAPALAQPWREAIARNMKISTTAVNDYVSQGLVPANAATYALVEASKEVFGELGNMMDTQSQTISGLWNTLESAPQGLILKMDTENLSGMKMVKDLLTNLISLFDTNTEAGKTMMAGINQGLEALLGPFKQFTGKEGLGKLTEMVNLIVPAIVTMFGIFAKGWQAFYDGIMFGIAPLLQFISLLGDSGMSANGLYDILKIIGFVLGALILGFSVVGATVLWVFESIWNVFKGISEILTGLGTMIIQGLIDGLTGGWDKAVETMKQGGEQLIHGFKTILGIASPSKVFEDMGGFTAEGYVKGIEGGTADAQNATSELVGSTATNIPGGGAARGPVNVSLTVNIDNAGAGADELEQRLRSMLPTHLAQLFEQLSMEAGA